MSLFNTFLTLFGGKKPETPQAPLQPSSTQNKKILIVEDEKDLRDFYTELLRGEGYEIITAANGQEGLELALAQNPRLILLDLMMPVMDGKTMLHTLRQNPAGKLIPVIVLTNAGDDENMRYVKLYEGVDDFLIKSNVTPDDITAKIKSIVF